jgi:hypothetical protein
VPPFIFFTAYFPRDPSSSFCMPPPPPSLWESTSVSVCALLSQHSCIVLFFCDVFPSPAPAEVCDCALLSQNIFIFISFSFLILFSIPPQSLCAATAWILLCCLSTWSIFCLIFYLIFLRSSCGGWFCFCYLRIDSCIDSSA